MGMDPALKATLQKQRYHIVGEHGGVKTCHWTKESLLRDRLLQGHLLRRQEPHLHADVAGR
ncbi:MAG: hypothetical protein O3B05_05730 [archaeon]|nr:hypothetical protein [archaeon]